MNNLRTGLTGLFAICVASCTTPAQHNAPEKPSGTMRVESDHREFARQVRTTDWQVPAAGIVGFTTYWPDGLYVITVKLKDGALVHNAGSYRIDGDVWCQKARIPADSKESCIRGYRTGENSFEAWRTDGTFASYWNFRVKK
jgi:hypothetical protein